MKFCACHNHRALIYNVIKYFLNSASIEYYTCVMSFESLTWKSHYLETPWTTLELMIFIVLLVLFTYVHDDLLIMIYMKHENILNYTANKPCKFWNQLL